jgi:hypothetical protein
MNAAQAIQKLRQVIRRQHKALATEETYVLWLRRYMAAVRQMPNALSSEKKLERFLTELAQQDVAASTQQQAFNAVNFFYKDVLGVPLKAVDALRVRRPAHLRHAPTVAETRSLLQAVPDVGGYSSAECGVRSAECGMRNRGAKALEKSQSACIANVEAA